MCYFIGSRCDVCSDNYYGNPEVPGGKCQPCECNNNIDLLKPGNCDPHTGICKQCLSHTTGDHCEICELGYFRLSKNLFCEGNNYGHLSFTKYFLIIFLQNAYVINWAPIRQLVSAKKTVDSVHVFLTSLDYNAISVNLIIGRLQAAQDVNLVDVIHWDPYENSVMR